MVGPIPKHEVSGQRVRFQNPSGAWGPWISFQSQVIYQTAATGSTSSGLDNFSYRRIPAGKVVTIFDAQQMLVSIRDFLIEGELVIEGDGELVLFEVA